MQSGGRGVLASPISFPEGPAINSYPSEREALPFSTADLPTVGEGLPTESSSSPTAEEPSEEPPQPFGSPSALWPVPDAAQTADTAQTDGATPDAVPSTPWDQLWDEGSSDVPDQAAVDSPPAGSTAQSASATLTQHPMSSIQQADTVEGSQQDNASHQVASSQDAVPEAVQEAAQSVDLPALSSSQSPGQLSDLFNQALPSDTSTTPVCHASTSLQPQDALPEQASPSGFISSWPDQATTPRLHTSMPDQATPAMPKASAMRDSCSGVGITPKTAGSKGYGSWWTPPLPKGLTPAWMKVKTPAWVKKMRQLELVSPVYHYSHITSPCIPYEAKHSDNNSRLWVLFSLLFTVITMIILSLMT